MARPATYHAAVGACPPIADCPTPEEYLGLCDGSPLSFATSRLRRGSLHKRGKRRSGPTALTISPPPTEWLTTPSTCPQRRCATAGAWAYKPVCRRGSVSETPLPFLCKT